MRELDRCDFCAEPADGVYEVLPPEVDAAERRLVLCADCRDTLSGVVEPLLDALEARDADAAASREPTVTVEPAASDAPAAAPTDEPTPDVSSADAAPATDADEAEADIADAEPADGTDDPASDVTGTSVSSDDSPDDAPVDADDEETDAGPSDDESAVSTATNATRPTGYRRVVRLLRNRPAAMTRTDLAELAEGAYDLSAREVEAVVDAAVENGDLEETAEGLRAT